MNRLRPITEPELSDEQRTLWDSLTASRGSALQMIAPDGGLVGPFNAFVHAPAIGRRLSSLGAHLRGGTSIDRRLIELAVCTVGAFWQAEFEFFAHGPMAIEHGVDVAVVDALRAGDVPEFTRDDERAVYVLTSQLLTDRRATADAYADVAALLGDVGVVELVTLIGYYSLISLTLNAFEVPIPPDATPAWGG